MATILRFPPAPMTPAERHRRTVEMVALAELRDGDGRLKDILRAIEAGHYAAIEDEVSAAELGDALLTLAGKGLIEPIWRIASTEGHDAAERAVRLLDDGAGGAW